MRVAVVGHVEWVDFVPVVRVPGQGEVAHGEDGATRAGGGGAVAAKVLAELAGRVDFFCALGDDGPGHAAAAELAERGIELHVAWRAQPTRRAVTMLDRDGERTILTIGERLEPRGADRLDWSLLERADGVYLTAADPAAARIARRAGALVATPRARGALSHPGLVLDALVYSAGDRDEAEWAERVAARARFLVATNGPAGGSWSGESEGRWAAVPARGQPRDSYGCGDSFAAGLTLGLASGQGIDEATALGARLGAAALTREGGP